MIAAYQTGETVRQIADRLGFHRDTVSATLAREGPMG
jgi:DNA-binding CsgD family transcriptional regulator